MNVESRFRIKYSPDADALIIIFHDDKPKQGEEIAPGIILHYNSRNELVEIEILDATDFIRAILQEYAHSSRDLSKVLPRITCNA